MLEKMVTGGVSIIQKNGHGCAGAYFKVMGGGVFKKNRHGGGQRL